MKVDIKFLLLIVIALKIDQHVQCDPSATMSPMGDNLLPSHIEKVAAMEKFFPNIYNMDSDGMSDGSSRDDPGPLAFQSQFSHDMANELSNEHAYDPGDEILSVFNGKIQNGDQNLGTLPEEPDYADTVLNGLVLNKKIQVLRQLENDLQEEQEIVTKSALLMRMLEDPSIDTMPILYVEESLENKPIISVNSNNEGLLITPGNNVHMAKRSRYYRRYPWKRHNRNRSNYEPELRYACTPTKEDVFKLLVNLHENRKGNYSKTVNFCNRKRPAKAIFTNIRFLG